MWDSGTSSEPARWRAVAASAAIASIVLWTAAVAANVLITLDEALELAFPSATVSRETLFLTEEQLAAAGAAAGSEPGSAMVTRFVARQQDRVIGYAYLDSHRVRTLPETLMVVIEPSRTVRRIEVVVFREPLEYIPRTTWYEQFNGRSLTEDLTLKRDIRPVTGATLTARATTEAVRRVLAIHAAVEGDVPP
jgi:hypothetical protein